MHEQSDTIMELSEALGITKIAEQCRTMHKEEWINTILIEITANPKITNNELAEKYGVHRNRISKYRNVIRTQQLKANIEAVNKIDNILEDRLIDMEDHDLINLRKQLIPQQVNINQELTETKTVTYNVNYSEEDKTAILNAYNRIRNKQSSSSLEPISLH